ncbi:MAG: SDR family oxidoreductase [Candidatus Pelagibacter sp.]
MKKKIFLAGVGGMLGEAFYFEFSKDYELYCTDKDVNEKWLHYLNFCEKDNYKSEVIKFNPEYLFHIGAFTDLEYCETHKDETIKNNTDSVISAVEISNYLKIPLLYISTAGIFDGKKDCYDETDIPKPIGIYAYSKYEAEKHVIKNCEKYLICRAGWMMGGGPKKDKKFVQKIIRQIKDGKKELFVVNDKFGTPTYTFDFAKNTKKLIETNNFGLYNMACEGNTSRLEVTKEIINILNLRNKIKIKEVESSFFSKKFFAERPVSENLINSALNKKGLNMMRPWKETLKEYINKYYLDYI